MSNLSFDDWQKTPQGAYLLSFEAQKLDAWVADIFGFHALQLGGGAHDFLRHNRIAVRQKIGDTLPADLLCDYAELPFAANSVDLIVMPHVLEFHEFPHRILREVERVLIPDGQVILTGFNPFSLWGAKRFLTRQSHRQYPFSGKFISLRKMKDWLQFLSFEPHRGQFGLYAPPFLDEIWLKRAAFMEAAGDRWWAFFGGVYMLRAIKRVRGMHLITSKWHTKLAPARQWSPASKEALKESNSDG